MNAAQLADESGLARSTISRWYSEGRTPDVPSIRVLISTLDVHPDELLEVLELRDGASDRISPAVRRAQRLMDRTEWTEPMIQLLEESIRFIQSARNPADEGCGRT